MIPFWHFGQRKRPFTRQENLRAFRIAFIVLVSTFAAYAIVAWLVFGHL
jgi:hypothetical protein